MHMTLTLVVLVLASYRLTRLVVRDTFPPVLWLRDRLAGGWRPLTDLEQHTLHTLRGSPKHAELKTVWAVDGEQRYVYRWKYSPFWLAELITCPWCASAYVSGAVVAGTWWTVGLPVPVLLWPAVWGGAALIASQEWA